MGIASSDRSDVHLEITVSPEIFEFEPRCSANQEEITPGNGKLLQRSLRLAGFTVLGKTSI
jgi:hypothetical protein